mgnify:CR=1 FL=1
MLKRPYNRFTVYNISIFILFAVILCFTFHEGISAPITSTGLHKVKLNETVSFSFNLSFSDTPSPFTALLLNIVSGRSKILSLFITSGPEMPVTMTVVTNNTIRTFSTALKFNESNNLAVTTHINSTNDSFIIETGDTSYYFRKAGFVANARYSVSILPEMESNYDASGNPLIKVENIRENGGISDTGSYTEIFLLLLLVVADILLFIFIHYRNKSRRKKESRVSSGQLSISNINLARQDVVFTSAVKLFGGFSIYSESGEELSKLFSPTRKELFLLLLFKQADTGISSAKLKELLWFDKSDESARNNRSVYITKLRQILNRVGPHEITSVSGNWKIDMKNISVDFLLFNEIIGKNPITQKDITDLIKIVRQGPLLPECQYQWLDEIKARTADCAITILLDFAAQLEISEQPDLISSIADALFVLDPLSEPALSYKCKYFINTGKGYLAKQLYANFIKDYRNIYGEDYNKTYSDIIIEKPE